MIIYQYSPLSDNGPQATQGPIVQRGFGGKGHWGVWKGLWSRSCNSVCKLGCTRDRKEIQVT